jgi:hypothetical protein
MRHLYQKLGTHTRADTVARGRALGLLALLPAPGPGHAGRLRAQAGRVPAEAWVRCGNPRLARTCLDG